MKSRKIDQATVGRFPQLKRRFFVAEFERIWNLLTAVRPLHHPVMSRMMRAAATKDSSADQWRKRLERWRQLNR